MNTIVRAKRASIVVAILFAFCVILSICFAVLLKRYYSEPRMPSEDDRRELIEEIERNIKVIGSYPGYTLPRKLSYFSSNSKANVVLTPDMRVIVLVKSSVGWKENFEGWVLSSKPLLPGEVTRDAYGRAIIIVPSLDSSDPVIRKKISELIYEVFFDLG